MERDFIMTTFSTNQIIYLMESGLNLTLSDEQKNILNNFYENPLLVNACAGSGKTTILILMILTALSQEKVSSEEVLAVTFSHKSKDDMDKRYQTYTEDLMNVGLIYDSDTPNFTTFHSLFFHLLQTNEEYQSVKVLENPKYLIDKLKVILSYKSPILTKTEIIEKLFQLNDYLINQGLTDDGIYPRNHTSIDDPETIDILSSCSREIYPREFYQEYPKIIEYYQELKHQDSLIDFNDMKLLLFKSMRNPKYLKQYQIIMSQYKMVLIDEFQDIDSLQWQIISKLLDQDTLNHLIVIGDDDQSIYSFRGSKPTYIMNYPSLVPNAKICQLSINYRTDGNILRCAIPMIKRNHIRLDKSLLAFNNNEGTINAYSVKNLCIMKYPTVQRLIRQIKDPTIDNRDIALLTRYNSSRTIIADYLADNDIYVDINETNNRSLVLQQNHSYKVIVHLIHALWEDRFNFFYEQAKRIGFNDYPNHIDYLKKQFDLKRIVKLSKYLKIAENSINSIFSLDVDDDYIQCDLTVIKAFRKITELRISTIPDKTIELYKTVTELTSDYFKYMIRQGYLSGDDLTKLFNYLEEEIKSYRNPQTFFMNEDRKENVLTNKLENAKQNLKVQFLSLHQAKGLEFKNVYLHGMTDKEIAKNSLPINYWFRPNLTFEKFIQIFAYRYDHDSGKLKIALNFINEFQELDKDKNFDLVNLQITLKNKINRKRFFVFYEAVVKYSAFIEEERRLLYVGVTRAKKELDIDISENANPLLGELAL